MIGMLIAGAVALYAIGKKKSSTPQGTQVLPLMTSRQDPSSAPAPWQPKICPAWGCNGPIVVNPVTGTFSSGGGTSVNFGTQYSTGAPVLALPGGGLVAVSGSSGGSGTGSGGSGGGTVGTGGGTGGGGKGLQ